MTSTVKTFDKPIAPHISERMLVFVVGAVQFVNIVDFMMVMPLGPDFAVALGVPTSKIGIVGGSYTLAAALSGFICSFFLDRFDRKKALICAVLGLSLGTLLGGYAADFQQLLAARFLAGAFGGPATSLSFAMIADVVPPQRRGKALGAVMGAFSAASVLGVPAGLELARLGDWRMPFFVLASIGLVVVILVMRSLPPFRVHLQADGQARLPSISLGQLFSRPAVIYSYLMTAAVMMGGFIVIPNFPAFLLHNLGYPREHLGLLYMIGGAISFVSMRMVGHLVDLYGSFRLGAVGAGFLIIIMSLGFLAVPPSIPAWLIFIGFMFGMSTRNVAYNTLTSKVPRPQERARFALIQSSVQHLASAIGAIASTWMLSEGAGGQLIGIKSVALTSIVLTVATPVLMLIVQRRIAGQAH